MDLHINANTFFVFDLDDTLFREIDFLKSAYRHISSQLMPMIGIDIYEMMWRKYQLRENVFQWIVQEFGEIVPDISLEWLLQEYREHVPAIRLSEGTAAFLLKIQQLQVPAGLITDGRSITQRNKLKALGIENNFQDIIISEEFGSEKPDERNYLYFLNKYPEREFYFFGDNTSKDFIVPSALGWKTICLKNSGWHIHPQNLRIEPYPDFIISNFQEISLFS
jgi:putative hydrolase of the HAD superfamily